MKHGLILFLAMMMLTMKSFAAEDWVVLRADANGKTTISGNAALADQKFTPASTFKVMIAWAALEEGLATPATKHLIKDSYVPGTPREVDMHEAMYFSSNDYFDWLGKKLGREKLEKYIAISGYAGGKPPRGWLDNMDLIEHGGTITITPRENHEFFYKLQQEPDCIQSGKLVSSQGVMMMLRTVLQWPNANDETVFWGKTGMAGGAVWFVGDGVRATESGASWTQAVTVFAKGGVELRPTVIEKFYAAYGNRFDRAWLKEYPFKK
jgi:beta-lactamase class D